MKIVIIIYIPYDGTNKVLKTLLFIILSITSEFYFLLKLYIIYLISYHGTFFNPFYSSTIICKRYEEKITGM